MAERERIARDLHVARHAGAGSAHIRIGVDDDDIRMVIADDGVGGTTREGNGLRGVRERIAALGGWINLDGSSGTTLTVSLPRQVAS